MLKRVICPRCGAEFEFDSSSKFEGNREREDYSCPDCGRIVCSVFTDQIPNVHVIKHGNSIKKHQTNC